MTARAPLSFLLACIACIGFAEGLAFSNPAWVRAVLFTGAGVYALLALSVWFGRGAK